MENHAHAMDHRKKRRRRRADRHPISAWLTLDEKVKGDVGLISDELYLDLFGRFTARNDHHSGAPRVRYIAISAWTSLSSYSISDGLWTIFPVHHKRNCEEDNSQIALSTIRFSPSCFALKSFAKALQGSPAARGNIRGKSRVEVIVLDVEPLNLNTVFVAVNGDALTKHDEVQNKFGGGFNPSKANGFTSQGKGKGKASLLATTNFSSEEKAVDTEEKSLIAATRQVFTSSNLVRQGDLLPLPLPTHPITHVSFPPAKITFCEPVSQGLLTEETNIVISRIYHKKPLNRASVDLAPRRNFRDNIMKENVNSASEDDDSSNEQFYSAVEDKGITTAPASTYASESSDSDSSDKESDSQSDDSLDNIISLAIPDLPSELSGFKSSAAAATPRAFGTKMTGFDTPGSVYSNFTATIARQGAAVGGRIFRTQGLLGRVAENLLYPSPFSDEDEEARVFVDTKMLLKIGCFSGDWIKVEAIAKPLASHQEQWGVEAFEEGCGLSDEFRAVKVYGLPDLAVNIKLRYPTSTANRQPGVAFGSPYKQPASTAWFSPILLANLDFPSFVRLSPLLNLLPEGNPSGSKNRVSKISNSSMPPIAKEVTLSRIFTPISTERALQTGLWATLKQHFESKRRILRKGDLLPLVIDVVASRVLAHPTAAPEADSEIEELVSMSLDGPLRNANSRDVAWFRVGQIIISAPDGDLRSPSADIWGGASCIEPMITRTAQAGSEQIKAPPTLKNTWEYYLGIKPPPKFQSYSGVYANLLCHPEPHVTPLRRRLRELIAAATSARAMHLEMDPLVILLHSTQRNIGKSTVATRASLDLGVHVFSIDGYDLSTEGVAGGGDVKTEALLKARFDRAMSCGPACTVVLFRHIEALTGERIISTLKEVIKSVKVLVATTTELVKVPEGVRSLFTYELEFSAPDESEREGILRGIIEERSINLAYDVDLASIAIKSAALVAGDLVDIVERAMIARQDRLEALIRRSQSHHDPKNLIQIRDVLVSGGERVTCLTKADFDLAVDAARKNFADSIGAPKIPNVSWEDVGGLENVKEAVIETIQLPLERPELFAKGMKKRSGILFYGPPGTGKTLLAKAIATEFSLNFFSVKGPELLNMYIGESEANVRRVFQRARDARPCVVFFDELDSVAPKRGNQGDSGGVMDRIVSQLLAELDGISDGDEGGGGVFVIGATNRPDLIDQALIRPGRFDKMLYLGVPDSHTKQLTILEALTRKFSMHPEISLRRVADSLPFTYTGADLYALCSDAMLKAITRQASAVDKKIRNLPSGPVTPAWFFDHLATKEDIAILVTEEDFESARRELVGSVR